MMERREAITLTEEQLDAVAEKAAGLAIAKMQDEVYGQIGRGIVKRFIHVVGVIAVAAAFFLHDYIFRK